MKIDDLKGKTLSQIEEIISKDENILSVALTDDDGGMLAEVFRDHGAYKTSIAVAALMLHRHNNNFMKSIYDGFGLFTASLNKRDFDFTPKQRDCLKNAHSVIQSWLAWDIDFAFKNQDLFKLVDKNVLNLYKDWPIKDVSKLSAKKMLSLANVLLWITMHKASFKTLTSNTQRVIYTMAGTQIESIQKVVFGIGKKSRRKGSKT